MTPKLDGNILLVKTIRPELLGSLLETLREKHSCFRPSLLTHHNAQESDFYKEQLGEVLIYDVKGDFSLLALPKRMLREIRRRRFSAVVYPYYNHPLKGYSNVIILCHAFGAQQVFACNLAGELTLVPRGELLTLLLKRLGALLLALLVSAGVTLAAVLPALLWRGLRQSLKRLV